MKLYLSGPVSGLPNLNRPSFDAVAAMLWSADYEVDIPHDHASEDATHEETMTICLPLMRISVANNRYFIYNNRIGYTISCSSEFCELMLDGVK